MRMYCSAFIINYFYYKKECIPLFFLFFFFNDTATTEIYTLSLHDALPIFLIRIPWRESEAHNVKGYWRDKFEVRITLDQDRKSTRLNSSHSQISYAVFCLKKKT